jgi:hypothetical protein
MDNNKPFLKTEERSNHYTADWNSLCKIDEGSRFRLHGLPRQEDSENNKVTTRRFQEILSMIRLRSSITVSPTEASACSPYIPPVHQMIEPGDQSEDPVNIDRAFFEDCALDPEFDEEDGEIVPRDAIDGRFYLGGDGLPWVWWIADAGRVYTKDGGHHHEVRHEEYEYAQQDSPPGGYFYFRDGVDMKTYFDHLDDALLYVRKEVEAQFDFESRLWLAFCCTGPRRKERDYILSHPHYNHRLHLIKEALERHRNLRSSS